MKTFSKWSVVAAIAALALLAATSDGRGSGNWSWTWIRFKPYRCDMGPTIYGLGSGGKPLVDGKFYLFGPILLRHVTNAPLAAKSSDQ